MRLANRDQYLKCLDAFLGELGAAAELGLIEGGDRLDALVRDRFLLDVDAPNPEKARRVLDTLEDVEAAMRRLRFILAS